MGKRRKRPRHQRRMLPPPRVARRRRTPSKPTSLWAKFIQNILPSSLPFYLQLIIFNRAISIVILKYYIDKLNKFRLYFLFFKKDSYCCFLLCQTKKLVGVNPGSLFLK